MLNLKDAFDFLAQEVLGLVHPFTSLAFDFLKFVAEGVFPGSRVFPGVFKGEVTGTVLVDTTVPSKEIDGVDRDILQHIGSGNLDHTFLELGRRDRNSIIGIGGRRKRQEVGEEAADVRRCHGSTGDGVGGILGSDPGGQDVKTGGKDVDAFAVVGEVGTGIGKGGSSDGDGLLCGGGGVVAGILVIVSGSDGEVKTGIDGSVNSEIKSLGTSTTKRHVGSRTLVSK